MKNPRLQSGLTIWTAMIFIFVIGFFAMLVAKLVPVYMTHFSILTSLESMQSAIENGATGKIEIKKLLLRRLQVNNVDDMVRDFIKVTKKGGAIEVGIKYEVRKPIMGNIDALITFDDKISVIPKGI